MANRYLLDTNIVIYTLGSIKSAIGYKYNFNPKIKDADQNCYHLAKQLGLHLKVLNCELTNESCAFYIPGVYFSLYPSKGNIFPWISICKAFRALLTKHGSR